MWVSPRPGGEADKFGNRFEGRWTVRHMIDVLAANADSIVIEGPGEAGEGIEFSIVRPDDTEEAHQVKRQYGNSNSWSIAILASLGVIRAAVLQIKLGREFHFVSSVPSRKLQELTDRSRGVDSFEVFSIGLTEGLRQDFRAFAAAVGTEAEAFIVLRSLHLQVIDELELRNTNETFARLLAINGAPAQAVPAVLAEIALDNLGRTLDAQSIRDELKRYGMDAPDVTGAHSLTAALREARNTSLIRISPIGSQLAKVREIAPIDGLRDRENETAALARFSRGDDAYLWLEGEPWAGKTALMASFVVDSQEEIDIVSFS
jgi:hypothetical protein